MIFLATVLLMEDLALLQKKRSKTFKKTITLHKMEKSDKTLGTRCRLKPARP